MSQYENSHLATAASSSRPGHASTPPNTSALHAGPSELAPFTSYGFIVAAGTTANVITLKTITESVASFTPQLQTKMILCLLSTVEQGTKRDLYHDIKNIRDDIVTVINKYTELSGSFKGLMAVPSQPNSVERAQGLLQSAWSATQEASHLLTEHTQALLDRGKLLSNQVHEKDKHPWFHAVINWKMPHATAVIGSLFGVCSASYNAGAAEQIEKHVASAFGVSTFLAFAAPSIALGGIFAFCGRDSHVYTPKAREDTRMAVEDVVELVMKFTKDILDLNSYWNGTHYRELYREGAWGGPLHLDQIILMLDKHVRDYSDIVRSLDTHLVIPGNTPVRTPGELHRLQNGLV